MLEKFGLDFVYNTLKERDLMVHLEFPTERFKVYIVGGAALMIYGQISKITNDIDIIKISDDRIRDLVVKDPMNERVKSTLDSFSIAADGRAIPIEIKEGTLAIDYYMYSLEDIVCSKLYTGRRKDLLDLKNDYIKNQINFSLLDKIIYEEMKIDCLNERRWNELVEYYKRYKEGTLWDDL